METVFVQYDENGNRLSQTGLPMPMQDADGSPVGGPFPILAKSPTATQKKTIWPEGARRVYQIEMPVDWNAAERKKKDAIEQIKLIARQDIELAMMDITVDFTAKRAEVLAKMESDIKAIG